MSAASAPAAPSEEAKKPFYKSVFFLGLVGGIVFLTVLRALQPLFLSAPEPLGKVAPFQLENQSGQTVSAESLRGSVWIAQFCDAPCPQTELLGRLVKPLSDVKHVPIVAISNGPATAVPEGVQVLTGSGAALTPVAESFAAAFMKQPHRGSASGYVKPGALGVPPMLALVDQTGAIRGFWPADELGQGNTINAARLLTKHGPTP